MTVVFTDRKLNTVKTPYLKTNLKNIKLYPLRHNSYYKKYLERLDPLLHSSGVQNYCIIYAKLRTLAAKTKQNKAKRLNEG